MHNMNRHTAARMSALRSVDVLRWLAGIVEIARCDVMERGLYVEPVKNEEGPNNNVNILSLRRPLNTKQRERAFSDNLFIFEILINALTDP